MHASFFTPKQKEELDYLARKTVYKNRLIVRLYKQFLQNARETIVRPGGGKKGEDGGR